MGKGQNVLQGRTLYCMMCCWGFFITPKRKRLRCYLFNFVSPVKKSRSKPASLHNFLAKTVHQQLMAATPVKNRVPEESSGLRFGADEGAFVSFRSYFVTWGFLKLQTSASTSPKLRFSAFPQEPWSKREKYVFPLNKNIFPGSKGQAETTY